MNQTKNKSGFLQNLWNLIRKIAKAIVSGIPTEKTDLTPHQKSAVYNTQKKMKTDDQKHYHKPVGKPVVEKQTLLKEKKKAKGSQ